MTASLAPLIRVCDTVDAVQARPLTDRVRQVYQDQGVPLDERVLEMAVRQEAHSASSLSKERLPTAQDGYRWVIKLFLFPQLMLWISVALVALGFWAGLSAQRALSQPAAARPAGAFTLNMEGMPPEVCRKELHALMEAKTPVLINGEPATPVSCDHPRTLSVPF